MAQINTDFPASGSCGCSSHPLQSLCTLQTPYLGPNISGDAFPEARLPIALLRSLLAAKEQKQDRHEAQSQMFCGRITQLLLPVQNQQRDGAW